MIYLDNAGTTAVLPECAKIASEYMVEKFHNPSAPYHESNVRNVELQEFRKEICTRLKGSGQFIFTSSGTESDNLAIFGTKKVNGGRVIVSAAEHPAVMNSVMELKQRGYDVVLCDVDGEGRVCKQSLSAAVTDNTCLVSVMHVNNETGAINDIKDLCATVKSINPNALFHSDGVQAVGKIPVALDSLGVDLYTVSGHKIHAPRGVGGLYIKNGVHIKPLLFGGGQEFNIRSSTENTPAIAAFVYALSIAVDNLSARHENAERCAQTLRDAVMDNPDYKLLSQQNCSPYIVALSLKNMRGEVMLHSLEKYGILIGTGSACSSKKSAKKLPTLLHLPKEYENGVIRVSFSSFSTVDEVNYFINKLNLEYNTLIKYIRG